MSGFYYKILLDTERDYTFTGFLNDITKYVKRFSCQQGLAGVWDGVANTSYLELALNNADGDFSFINTSALYYGKLRLGTMVRVQISIDAVTWANLCTLKISSMSPEYAIDGKHEIVLKCNDLMADFQNQEFVAPLLTNVRVDQALDALHERANAFWPYESYYQFPDHTAPDDGRGPYHAPDWTNFGTAETTLTYIGDNLDKGEGVKVQQYLKDAMQAEVFGIYWFSMRSEQWRFLSRYHASDTAVSWYITDKKFSPPKFTYGRDFVNDYSLSYYPRAIGTAHSTLWTNTSAIQINARDTKRITLKYRDPDNPSSTVGALAVDDLVRDVDFIANSEQDGSGDDWTRFLSPTLIKGPSSSEVIFFNRKVGDPAYLTTLQLRGTPITSYNKESVRGYNSDSNFGLGSDQSTGNDRKSKPASYFAISDAETAQAIADYMVNVFSNPQEVIERLSITVNPTDTATMTQVMNRTIGDVINVTDALTGHDMDYMIVAEQHSVNPQNELHNVTYTLRPSNRAALFILDTSFSDAGDTLSF